MLGSIAWLFRIFLICSSEYCYGQYFKPERLFINIHYSFRHPWCNQLYLRRHQCEHLWIYHYCRCQVHLWIIVLPAITPFSQTVSLGTLSAGTYTLIVRGLLSGTVSSTLTVSPSLSVGSCCGINAGFTSNADHLLHRRYRKTHRHKFCLGNFVLLV